MFTSPFKNEVFLFFAPKKLKISSMQFERYYTKIRVISPKKIYGYFTSKFKTDKTETISSNQQRIWIGILKRSLTENIIIQKAICIFHPRI